MKILFLGDIVAKSGRNAVMEQLPKLQKEYGIDFTIVNAENAAHGKGITAKIYRALKASGVDVITLGNHAFSKECIIKDMDDFEDMVRPINMEPYTAGYKFVVRQCKGHKIAVVNVLGKVFIDNCSEDPIETLDALLAKLKADTIIVDFHAEATGEKEIMFEVFKDRCTAILGTHTHVQTADEKVEHGCAYITDVGMCGPYRSILGRDIEEVLARSVRHEKTHYTPADTPSVVCGVVIDVNEEGRATSIERIQIRPQEK